MNTTNMRLTRVQPIAQADFALMLGASLMAVTYRPDSAADVVVAGLTAPLAPMICYGAILAIVMGPLHTRAAMSRHFLLRYLLAITFAIEVVLLVAMLTNIGGIFGTVGGLAEPN